MVAADVESSTTDQPERVFSQSILISGIRCTLTYVIFPFVFPILGITSGIGSTIGLIIGTIAIRAAALNLAQSVCSTDTKLYMATVTGRTVLPPS